MTTKNAKPSGIRIQLKGLRTTSEMRAMLHEAIDQLEDLAVTHLRGVNLYATPADQDGSPVTPRRDRRKITSLVIEGPYPSAADEYGA